MIRSITTAILTSAALLAAAGAPAQTPSTGYVATPAVAPAKTTLMTRDTAWNFRDGSFVTTNAPMRDMVACQLVARNAGLLTGFVANGKAYDAAALDQCNAKAKVAKTVMAKGGTTEPNAN
ncbi:hypothetical protein M0208_08490 [Sphingomonas sp. SUN019]|uniref:CC_3452 family protein n=1 Tax=Sphingomonas sp. SUN019 TaxID=2937788 RepID=UPI002164CD47|nr:hypothetical protein [Sphingomonas sp. SUN019]UVO50553.1 hypothetical protein M0208_08490 [Sphingomonas sp. SUN019]